jgi:hypothetical protein
MHGPTAREIPASITEKNRNDPKNEATAFTLGTAGHEKETKAPMMTSDKYDRTLSQFACGELIVFPWNHSPVVPGDTGVE